MVVGARPKGVDFLPRLARQVDVAGVRLQLLHLVTIAISLALLAGMTWLLRATRLGLEMRAAAENFRMAEALGVRANRVIAAAFAISGLLGRCGRLHDRCADGLVQPRMGLQLVVIAFVGTVVGGLGSLPGAAIGGFVVGVGTILLQALLPEALRPFREAFVFVVVALVLIVRPLGLFPSRSLRQRV